MERWLWWLCGREERDLEAGRLAGVPQEIVRAELESGPEGGGEEVDKHCLGGRMAGLWELTEHGGDSMRSTAS